MKHARAAHRFLGSKNQLRISFCCQHEIFDWMSLFPIFLSFHLNAVNRSVKRQWKSLLWCWLFNYRHSEKNTFNNNLAHKCVNFFKLESACISGYNRSWPKMANLLPFVFLFSLNNLWVHNSGTLQYQSLKWMPLGL